MKVINEQQIDNSLYEAGRIYKVYEGYGDPYTIHKAIESIHIDVLLAIKKMKYDETYGRMIYLD